VFLDVGGTDYVYALMGASNKFRRWTFGAPGAWSNMANTPQNVKKGARDTDGTYIYACRVTPDRLLALQRDNHRQRRFVRHRLDDAGQHPGRVGWAAR